MKNVNRFLTYFNVDIDANVVVVGVIFGFEGLDLVRLLIFGNI